MVERGQKMGTLETERRTEHAAKGTAALRARLRWPQHLDDVWRDALSIWLLTRALFVLMTLLVPWLLVRSAAPVAGGPFGRWVTADAYHFTQIAEHGYVALWWRAAYWPLFPALEHLLMPVFGGSAGLAGMFVSNAAFLGALVVLRRLLGTVFDAEVARRACLYLAIFPTAFYFFAPYSESLFMLFSIGVFVALHHRRWAVAGVLAGLATLTRSAGVLLLVPFAVELFAAWRARTLRWHAVLWALCIPAAVGIFAAYLQYLFQDPLAFAHAQSYWKRSLQWPWTSLVLSLQGLTQVRGMSTIGAAHLALNLVSMLGALGLAVLAMRVLPRSYGLYALAILVYAAMFPVLGTAAPLEGYGRYVLMAFPLYVALAIWARRRWLHEALLVSMPVGLALLAAHYLLALSSG